MQPPPPPPPRKGMPTWAWVAIIGGVGCLVVIPIIAIIAAIAIPGLLSAQRASNERMASACLKQIATAQADFRMNDRDDNQINDFWTADVFGLYAIKAGQNQTIRLVELTVANADPSPRPADSLYGVSPPSTAIPKAGYFIAAVPKRPDGRPYGERNQLGFAFCAYPANHPATGRLTFLVTEEATLWRKDTRGERVLQVPPDPAVDGWSRVD